MKNIYLIPGLILLIGASLSCEKQRSAGIHALFLVPRNVGANYYLMRDVIEEYGWNVTHTGALDTITACPWFATYGQVYPIIPDLRLSDIDNIADYDCLVIPPSAGNYAAIENSNGDLIESKEALALVRQATQRGLAVYSTCAGVRVLAAADVVRGRFIVGSPRFRDEYIAAGANYVGRPGSDNPPTIDENIITCARGQYYNYANVMAIATVIENNGKRGDKDLSDVRYISSQPIDYGCNDIVWARTYGGVGADGGRAFCETTDDGYLIVGYTFAPFAHDADILVVKTDTDGNMIWSKRLGGAGTEYGNACMALEDGFLVLGYTTSFGAGSKDFYLVRMDSEGRVLWSNTYGGMSWDVGTAICQADRDHYYVCGFTHSFGRGEEDIYLLKIDQNGNKIWAETYGGFRTDMANSIHATPDGGCIVSASSGSYSDNTDFYLMKIDSNGKQKWAQSYGAEGKHGHGFDWCKRSVITSDGGCILTGYSDCNDVMDVVVIRTDSLGSKQWLKSFGRKPFYEYGNAVCETEGGYVIVGITKSMVEPTAERKKTYNNDLYMTKLNIEGKIIWEMAVGGLSSDWANAVHVARDGSLVILGHTDAGALGSLDVCLLKMVKKQ